MATKKRDWLFGYYRVPRPAPTYDRFREWFTTDRGPPNHEKIPHQTLAQMARAGMQTTERGTAQLLEMDRRFDRMLDSSRDLDALTEATLVRVLPDSASLRARLESLTAEDPAPSTTNKKKTTTTRRTANKQKDWRDDPAFQRRKRAWQQNRRNRLGRRAIDLVDLTE